ncbi:hypothetical protein PVA45_04835 [Entomospira entomophila]|uniref:Lipoprotein n=1 Tax=Entomospira entomophila TaxID=2719988 RepID=A0A968G945_9SPIO|nr:hypothetical protein [Entomospira entomophilus]NIZ40827.1 hypothetical protein [Entomospira entomophilus]WDI35039.1 hypothetical protein PVA45_04835 [Entomospira entomophilus]
MKKIAYKVVMLSLIFLLMACQDPIFWTQQNEKLTPSNNLSKVGRIFDVDIDDSEQFLYAIVGGLLYRRAINSNEWKNFGLPGFAHSLDVRSGRIALTNGIYSYDFTMMKIGFLVDPVAKRAFFDKDQNSVVIAYSRASSVPHDMDVFTVEGISHQFVGRYIGQINQRIVSSTGVFDSNGVNVGETLRDPRGTDGRWLVANTRAGEVAGDAFVNPVMSITGVSITSRTEGFLTNTSDGSGSSLALVGVAVGGYREVFINDNGDYVARIPLSSIIDSSVYRASELNTAYIERFFYKNNTLFALTTDKGLWTQRNRSGVWVWE